MNNDFWRECWRLGRIGFHEGKPNAQLVAFFDRLGLAPGARILVPFCGKSEDMAWLAARGLDVTGVELVPEAAQAFFAEHKLEPREEAAGPFRKFSAGGVTIYAGDMFELGQLGLAPFDASYDRGGFAALPLEVRERYAPVALGALAPGARSILITFSTEPPGVSGPPFHVDEAEVRARYGPEVSLELLSQDPDWPVHEQLRACGMTRVTELVFLMTKAR
jgi:thiopurine S-methyltransferase